MWSNNIWWYSKTELGNDGIKKVVNKFKDQCGARIIWGWLTVSLRHGFIGKKESNQRNSQNHHSTTTWEEEQLDNPCEMLSKYPQRKTISVITVDKSRINRKKEIHMVCLKMKRHCEVKPIATSEMIRAINTSPISVRE